MSAAGILFLAATTGRVLLGYRSSAVHAPHCWSVIGGSIDEGETPRKPSASLELFMEAGMKVSNLDFTGAVVTIEQDNGRTFIFTDAYTIGDVELDTSTGKVPIEIEGEDCTEQ